MFSGSNMFEMRILAVDLVSFRNMPSCLQMAATVATSWNLI